MTQQKKKSLGLEKKIANMNPKLKELYLNIISITMIFILVYGVISFIITYLDTNSFMGWFSTEYFVTTCVVLVFLFIAQKFIKGGKFHVPQQSQTKKKTQFNIPDTYGVRGKGLNLSGEQPRNNQKQQLNIPNYFGEKQPQQRQQNRNTQLNIPNYFGQKPQQQKPYPKPLGQKKSPQQPRKPRQQQTQLNIPNYFGQKQRQQVNVNNYWRTNQQQPTRQPTRKPTRKPTGSWRCPKCGNLVIGRTCKKCGYQRR